MEKKFNEKDYMMSLKNRIWKLLPIYEGKNLDKKVVCTREEAYNNFYMYLSRITTELVGAKNINKDNGYYAELLYLLEGMKEFSEDEHDRVRDIVLHCCNLCDKFEVE